METEKTTWEDLDKNINGQKKQRFEVHSAADALDPKYKRTDNFDQYENDESITWSLLCKLEPRLKELYKEIKQVKDDKTKNSFCANRVWYGWGNSGNGFKNRLHPLAGWEATGEDPRLHTRKAYDIAYKKLYNALPDCRNCICM